MVKFINFFLFFNFIRNNRDTFHETLMNSMKMIVGETSSLLVFAKNLSFKKEAKLNARQSSKTITKAIKILQTLLENINYAEIRRPLPQRTETRVRIADSRPNPPTRSATFERRSTTSQLPTPIIENNENLSINDAITSINTTLNRFQNLTKVKPENPLLNPNMITIKVDELDDATNVLQNALAALVKVSTIPTQSKNRELPTPPVPLRASSKNSSLSALDSYINDFDSKFETKPNRIQTMSLKQEIPQSISSSKNGDLDSALQAALSATRRFQLAGRGVMATGLSSNVPLDIQQKETELQTKIQQLEVELLATRTELTSLRANYQFS
eukprot:TRINITY_DN8093_c0_g1_i1.p1 TRINITY_DN8093_c0_g1~~TRINITY_DN8093_c0_g1_i1.p1  ORF type:complete len:328 (+),score=92.47 TRINITY_DN8093_c0_g1_i1:662-1645(+)